MNKLNYIFITIICICLSACSYSLNHITLNEKSDADWTEVKKSNTSSSAEITKHNLPKSTNSEAKKNSNEPSKYSQKLRELKKLKDEGLLTDKEYEQKRKAIVDGM